MNLKAYVGVLAVFSLALASSWAYSFGVDVGPRYVVGTLVLGLMLALAELFPVRVGERSEISAVDVGLIASVVILGPLWAMLAALPCALIEGNRDPLRSSYAAARNATEVLLAGVVFSLAAHPLLSYDTSPPVATTVYATLMAALTLQLANKMFDATLLKIKYGQTFGRTWEVLFRPYLHSDAINVLTAGLGMLALLLYGPAAAVVLVAGSVASHALTLHSRALANRSRDLEAEVLSLKRALAGAVRTFGGLLVGALGRKDGHADRKAAATAVYAADLAREMGFDKERIEQLRLAGLLHDVGMVFLPEELLVADKPNSIAQRDLVEHPVLGEAALAAVPGYEELARWIRWHHERPDGRGYPDKLRGPWIPPEARILAVAQAYAGSILDGPRRPGLSPTEARGRLVEGMDGEFDATVVKAFLRILDTESEGYRMADDHRFVPPGQPVKVGAKIRSEAGTNAAAVDSTSLWS